MRYEIFVKNYEEIIERNKQNRLYTEGINKFSDLTKDEISEMFPSMKEINIPKKRVLTNKILKSYPSSIDWRKKNAVTGLKDQGMCGSCYAIAPIELLEGYEAIITKQLREFSVQEVLECVSKTGCNGGLPLEQLNIVLRRNYACLESEYPLTGGLSTCNVSLCETKVQLHNLTDVEFYETENDLMDAIQTKPIVVGLNIMPIYSYTGGIFNSTCDSQVNHVALLVGYGTEDGVDYWIIKNTLGPHYGEEGYIRIKRFASDRYGLCGLAHQSMGLILPEYY